jgi:hypothetical protein
VALSPLDTLAHSALFSALYFQLIRDCYEAIVIASFFFLLLAYLSNPPATPDHPCPAPYATRAERTAALREVVRDIHLKAWMWPFGWVKWRPANGGKGEGEVSLACAKSNRWKLIPALQAFLWLMRIGIGQYVIIRPLSTLVSCSRLTPPPTLKLTDPSPQIAVVSHYLGWYCLVSWSPKFTHLYTAIAITISVTIAMYCVVSLLALVR